MNFAWMLQWIPDSVFAWIVGAIFLAGVLAYVASKLVGWLPVIGRYRLAAELAGIASMIVGAYFYCDVGYRATLAEFKQKVAIAEQQSKDANAKLEKQTREQLQAIKDVKNENQKLIKDTVGRQVDAQCSLPNSVISLHDSASRNQVARGSAIADGTTSKFKASELLGRVVDNYGACHENAAKLQAWQEWYREQQKIFEQVK